ncbi:MAG: hypothetical protein PF517_11485 [Salinivirgaceae bacterium]|jgi:hypothetical protein|nr:hypothetical protein [Salinivirgaceae bacterium]
MKDKNEDIHLALLEAIWIMRWNKTETALSAVLEVEEAHKMCEDIIVELDKAGYKIVKKTKSNSDVNGG